ncbi:GIY-YIG nuclease family protein [Sphingomonas montanisoli]|uniref:GIY-YIG nuclease family protein n=1 Tax=Sphingomonas montanisoli TaxID=2606412 RepID=A0A5D9C063_9SPHN|nr:GIY-YIG nuclease family protein [Sphingomonas montanisoli]
MTNQTQGTLYIGVTANLAARVHAHRTGTGSDFCREHGLTRLVYAEPYDQIEEAIAREKSLKAWKRSWKLNLIEKANPGWTDLFDHIL